MGHARVTTPATPAQIAARAAPKGPPLTDEERARIEAARRSSGVPHSEIMRQLEERKRQGG